MNEIIQISLTYVVRKFFFLPFKRFPPRNFHVVAFFMGLVVVGLVGAMKMQRPKSPFSGEGEILRPEKKGKSHTFINM